MNYFLLFLTCQLTFTTLPIAGSERPNILFLLSDDQAWNGLSCRMHPEISGSVSAIIETPNLARLASEGMRFSAAYSPASVCSPTRISLQTGRSPAACGWTKAAPVMTESDGYPLIPPPSRKGIESDETTVAEMLRTTGYMTAHFGKWHLRGGGPERHGYDESDGDTGNQDAAPHKAPNPVDIFGMGKRAMAFMEKSRNAQKPFFIQMSYHALHFPENATEALREKYARQLPSGNIKASGRAALSEDLDRGVGELLDCLKRLDIEDSTFVIYFSDNGSSSRGLLRGGKGGVWEGGIRVPLIVRGPGVPANSWCHQRVVGYDFFPTFCEWAGVTKSLPVNIEGGSLVPLLKGATDPVKRPREELVFHFPHYQGDSPHTALFLGEYKLIRFYEDKSKLLFNVESDPGETSDLASSMPELVGDLEGRMEAYLKAVNAGLPRSNPSHGTTTQSKQDSKQRRKSSN